MSHYAYKCQSWLPSAHRRWIILYIDDAIRDVGVTVFHSLHWGKRCSDVSKKSFKAKDLYSKIYRMEIFVQYYRRAVVPYCRPTLHGYISLTPRVSNNAQKAINFISNVCPYRKLHEKWGSGRDKNISAKLVWKRASAFWSLVVLSDRAWVFRHHIWWLLSFASDVLTILNFLAAPISLILSIFVLIQNYSYWDNSALLMAVARNYSAFLKRLKMSDLPSNADIIYQSEDLSSAHNESSSHGYSSFATCWSA